VEKGKGKYFIEGSLRLDQTLAKPAEDNRLDAWVDLCKRQPRIQHKSTVPGGWE